MANTAAGRKTQTKTDGPSLDDIKDLIEAANKPLFEQAEMLATAQADQAELRTLVESLAKSQADMNERFEQAYEELATDPTHEQIPVEDPKAEEEEPIEGFFNKAWDGTKKGAKFVTPQTKREGAFFAAGIGVGYAGGVFVPPATFGL